MNDNMNTVGTNAAVAEAALGVWLRMWNTDSGIARRICSDDFRIHFLVSDGDGSNPGDGVLGAESFVGFLERWRGRHPKVVFTEVSRAVDAAHGRMLWNVQDGEVAAGGIDVFDFTEDGLIREVWSTTGTRTHSA